MFKEGRRWWVGSTWYKVWFNEFVMFAYCLTYDVRFRKVSKDKKDCTYTLSMIDWLLLNSCFGIKLNQMEGWRAWMSTAPYLQHMMRHWRHRSETKVRKYNYMAIDDISKFIIAREESKRRKPPSDAVDERAHNADARPGASYERKEKPRNSLFYHIWPINSSLTFKLWSM